MNTMRKDGVLRLTTWLVLPLTLGAAVGASAQPYSSSSAKNPTPYPTVPPESASMETMNLTASSTANPPDVDVMHRKIRTQLRNFTNWLVQNNAKGFIGEVGWPHEVSGQTQTNAAAWNALADAWYNDADDANLWVTAWASGLWIGPQYNLGIYTKVSGTAVNTAESQAAVVEAHPTTPNYMRGINLTGAENAKGYPNTGFSNQNLGRMGWEYTYPNLGTFQYLSGRGIKLIRLPFRWERIQPLPNQALSQSELTALKTAVSNAKSCGMKVILDVHNYGRYNFNINGTATGKLIGSPELPISAFQNLWTRLSTEFKTDPDVFYGLMNEPHGFNITVDGLTGAKLWEKISQEGLNAIRANGDNKLVLVPGNFYSGAQNWYTQHPKGWITDPANNFRYEAHHYWDTDNSGDYAKQITDPNDSTKKIWVPQTYQDNLNATNATTYNPNPTLIEVIQDNTDPIGVTGVTITGKWLTGNLPGYYGTNYIHNDPTKLGGQRVLYQPKLAGSGNYEVWVRWVAYNNRDSNAPIDIFTSSGLQTVNVNQTINNATWVSLGVHHLNWANAYVNIRTNNISTKVVVADAVKFTPVP